MNEEINPNDLPSISYNECKKTLHKQAKEIFKDLAFADLVLYDKKAIAIPLRIFKKLREKYGVENETLPTP